MSGRTGERTCLPDLSNSLRRASVSGGGGGGVGGRGVDHSPSISHTCPHLQMRDPRRPVDPATNTRLASTRGACLPAAGPALMENVPASLAKKSPATQRCGQVWRGQREKWRWG